MITLAIGVGIGILGTVVYNHFFPSKVGSLGDSIVNKVDPPK